MKVLILFLFFLISCGKSSSENVSCPSSFVEVPSNSSYIEKTFCVAKYEMKDQGGNAAVSQADDLPWTNIDRDTAQAQCVALGPGYDLLSNSQWQTIARNIESVNLNWSSGIVGVGFIHEGHTDNSPANKLAAADNDNNSYFGTGQTSGDQKRIHFLSNGSVIWDFSGNVWEWVRDDNSTDYGADGFMSQITNTSNPIEGKLDDDILRTLKNQFGPAGDYLSSLNTSPYGRLGRAFTNSGTSGGIYRGGSFVGSDDQGGIFSVSTKIASNLEANNLGFRCVFESSLR